MPGRFNLDDYVGVQSRITQFWQEYPDGRIATHLLSDVSHFEQVIIRADVFKHRDHPVPDVTGIAAETKGSGGANTTSWHENAETSAIGRALANLGYATSEKDRPSREEMRKVDRNTGEIEDPSPPSNGQAPPAGGTTASDKQKAMIRGLWKETGHTVLDMDGTQHHDAMGLNEALYMRFQVGIDGISKAQASHVIEGLQRAKAEMEVPA